MKAQPFRLAAGGRIRRDTPLQFTFDGRAMHGFAGDTLASALLANGVRTLARSFKYHRPRGIVSAGPEEPSALVTVGAGAKREPNLRATQVPLIDGLAAFSQNAWPSVRFDLLSVLDTASALIPAGFYYKTFMWPRHAWTAYERHIRRVAGLGEAPSHPDPDYYEHHHAHCDVLVIGAGPAGLAAALAAARAGARVILASEGSAPGGGLLRAGNIAIADGPADEWVGAVWAELAAASRVTLLNRTTVFGVYDDRLYGLVSRGDGAGAPRLRLSHVRAGQAVLAAGAIERPLVFANNDRPGVMLAGAARTYANRFAVRAGKRAVVFTNNDSAYAAALDLKAAGITIAAIVDARPDTLPSPARARAAAAGMPVRAGSVVVAARGRRAVTGAIVGRFEAGSVHGEEAIACDLLCVSGGWSPTVHIFSQAGGRLHYDARAVALTPASVVPGLRLAGAVTGETSLARALSQGLTAGAAAAAEAGFGDGAPPPTPACAAEETGATLALWEVPGPKGRKRFVDLQDDVTVADIQLATREGYDAVEHLKRYTTLGMGTDQGKTSNVNGLAILAGLRGEPIDAVGTTTFRPPYTPVTLGAIVGRERGADFAPVRHTPLHDCHAALGAVFGPAGLWKRPRYYACAGESAADTIAREARAVRTGVGLCDVSTLGRIDIQGRDAVQLLNRVYTNGWSKLAVGRIRYGIMLREDGLVLDDGTTARLGETRYTMTTTTANAARVLQHLEHALHVVWPDLAVRVASTTEQYAVVAVAGPKSRAVLEAVCDGISFAAADFPFMAWRTGLAAGIPATVFAISFSGERAYEVAVPADYGPALWEALLDTGAAHGITPYGTEALGVLRVEKGHFVVGPEADGRVSAADLGLARLMSTKKDFIGRWGASRPALMAEDRLQLVGLISTDGATAIPPGAQLVADGEAGPPAESQGHVSSPVYSVALERPIALALLRRGRARHGERLLAAAPLQGKIVPVEVCSPVFHDPANERLHG